MSLPESPTYAKFSTRLLAQNIDLLILLAIAYGLNLFVVNDRILYFSLVIFQIIYGTIAELGPWHGTLGKKLLGIEVVAIGKSERFPFLRSLWRNSTKFLSLVLFFSGFVMISLNPRRQGLHDWLSGSIVVFVQK